MGRPSFNPAASSLTDLEEVKHNAEALLNVQWKVGTTQLVGVATFPNGGQLDPMKDKTMERHR